MTKKWAKLYKTLQKWKKNYNVTAYYTIISNKIIRLKKQ